jgi:hypothetical protein
MPDSNNNKGWTDVKIDYLLNHWVKGVDPFSSTDSTIVYMDGLNDIPERREKLELAGQN